MVRAFAGDSTMTRLLGIRRDTLAPALHVTEVRILFCRVQRARAQDARDTPLVATSGARPLLVVDGDSFTHRAYHALPKTMRREDGGPANALIGFTDMLLRLWRAERPRAVLVGWDTLEVPTYRHEALEAYQSGRVFEDELSEQLHLLPGARRVRRIRQREGTGLRGGRLPRRRPRRGRRRRAASRSSRPRTATRSSSSPSA